MNKKVYLTPQINFIPIEAKDIIATSTGATGEDVPWANSRRNDSFDDSLDDYK